MFARHSVPFRTGDTYRSVVKSFRPHVVYCTKGYTIAPTITGTGDHMYGTVVPEVWYRGSRIDPL
jgi:hypothetical protein